MPGGWAWQFKAGPETYVPIRDGDKQAPKGVTVSDMPQPRPVRVKRKIKGLPGATDPGDADYAPGGGSWRPA